MSFQAVQTFQPGSVQIGGLEPAGDYVRTAIERVDPLVAPLTKGQRVATLKVTTVGGTPVATVALTAQQDVPQAGLMGRAWDALRLWIK